VAIFELACAAKSSFQNRPKTLGHTLHLRTPRKAKIKTMNRNEEHEIRCQPERFDVHQGTAYFLLLALSAVIQNY
jgi:hypothetical protein